MRFSIFLFLLLPALVSAQLDLPPPSAGPTGMSRRQQHERNQQAGVLTVTHADTRNERARAAVEEQNAKDFRQWTALNFLDEGDFAVAITFTATPGGAYPLLSNFSADSLTGLRVYLDAEGGHPVAELNGRTAEWSGAIHLLDGQEHRLGLTRRGAILRLLVDGKELPHRKFSAGSVSSDFPLRIGYTEEGAFAGTVDRVSIYSGSPGVEITEGDGTDKGLLASYAAGPGGAVILDQGSRFHVVDSLRLTFGPPPPAPSATPLAPAAEPLLLTDGIEYTYAGTILTITPTGGTGTILVSDAFNREIRRSKLKKKTLRYDLRGDGTAPYFLTLLNGRGEAVKSLVLTENR